MCTDEQYADRLARLETKIDALEERWVESRDVSVKVTENTVLLAHIDERINTLGRIVWGVAGTAGTALVVVLAETIVLLLRTQPG